jgi:hypothetical protein
LEPHIAPPYMTVPHIKHCAAGIFPIDYAFVPGAPLIDRILSGISGAVLMMFVRRKPQACKKCSENLATSMSDYN